jgi:hypothetical protein
MGSRPDGGRGDDRIVPAVVAEVVGVSVEPFEE